MSGDRGQVEGAVAWPAAEQDARGILREVVASCRAGYGRPMTANRAGKPAVRHGGVS